MIKLNFIRHTYFRKLSLVITISVLFLNLNLNLVYGVEDFPSVDDFVKEALANNPKLEAALSRYQAMEKAVPQAGALPDPQIRFGLMNLPVNSFAFDQEPMTGKSVSVMQMFPFPGKLGLATDIAEFNASVSKFRHEEIRNQIVAMVKRAYYDIYAIDRAMETVETNQTLMEQFVSVAETKYATGAGLQQDVLRAQVELLKLEDDLIMWQQKRRTVEAKLNALLNRPMNSSITKTPKDVVLSDKVFTMADEEQVIQTRPLLKVWAETVHRAEIEIKLARRDYWPNFAIGASYSQRDDLKNGAVMHDFFSATLSLSIPLYFKRKQSAKTQQRELDLAAIKSEYENVQNEVFSDIESLVAELGRNRKRVELFKDGILLRAQQSLESALGGYQVGKVDFLTLINNRMMLQNYELQYYRALADYHKVLASYEMATGQGIL